MAFKCARIGLVATLRAVSLMGAGALAEGHETSGMQDSVRLLPTLGGQLSNAVAPLCVA
jgi:hypothetical protein